MYQLIKYIFILPTIPQSVKGNFSKASASSHLVETMCCAVLLSRHYRDPYNMYRECGSFAKKLVQYVFICKPAARYNP